MYSFEKSQRAAAGLSEAQKLLLKDSFAKVENDPKMRFTYVK